MTESIFKDMFDDEWFNDDNKQLSINRGSEAYPEREFYVNDYGQISWGTYGRLIIKSLEYWKKAGSVCKGIGGLEYSPSRKSAKRYTISNNVYIVNETPILKLYISNGLERKLQVTSKSIRFTGYSTLGVSIPNATCYTYCEGDHLDDFFDKEDRDYYNRLMVILEDFLGCSIEEFTNNDFYYLEGK